MAYETKYVSFFHMGDILDGPGRALPGCSTLSAEDENLKLLHVLVAFFSTF